MNLKEIEIFVVALNFTTARNNKIIIAVRNKTTNVSNKNEQ